VAVRAGEPLDVKGFWHGQPQEPSGSLSGGGAGPFDSLEDATHSLFDELRQVLGGELKVVEQRADPCRSFVGVGSVAGHRGGRIAGRRPPRSWSVAHCDRPLTIGRRVSEDTALRRRRSAPMVPEPHRLESGRIVARVRESPADGWFSSWRKRLAALGCGRPRRDDDPHVTAGMTAKGMEIRVVMTLSPPSLRA
jgi:hypothetical protein